MKIKKYLTKVGALALAMVLLLPLTISDVEAQSTAAGVFVQVAPVTSVADVVTAVATDVALYVKYVGKAGTTATNTIAVAGNNSIAFVSGGAADGTINDQADVAPAAPCGATPGTLDLTNAACNTFTKLVTHINRSANWVAVLHAVQGADSSNGTLNNLSATSATGPDGVGLLKLTSAALNVNVVLVKGGNGGRRAGFGINNQFNAGLAPGSSLPQGLAPNPFVNDDTTVVYASENVTSSGTVGNFQVLCIVPAYVRRPASATKNITNYSEDVQTLYLETGAATTVTGKIDEFLNAGGLTCNGGKLLVNISATTTLTAPVVIATGFVKPRRT